MKNIIFALVAITVFASSLSTVEARGLNNTEKTILGIGGGLFLLNGAYVSGYRNGQQAEQQQAMNYQPQVQIMTYVGPNGGAATFDGLLCLATPAHFPNGAIFTGWVQDWQGNRTWTTRNVPPGAYPAQCY